MNTKPRSRPLDRPAHILLVRRVLPWLVAVLGCALGPGAGHAQETSTVRPDVEGPSVPLLTPGDGAVDASGLRMGTDTTRVFLRTGGETRLRAVQIEERSRVMEDGAPAVRQVLRVERPGAGAILVDTTWHALPDLRPLRHRSHGNGRTLKLRYPPGEVVGTRAPDSGRAEAIRATPPGPFFDPSASLMVLEALALDPGRRIRIAFLDHRSHDVVPQAYTVRGFEEIEVDGREAPVRTLRVEGELADGRRIVYWMDPETRRLVQGRTPAGPDAEMIVRP